MNAPGPKRVIGATEIRKRILLAFELAEVGMSEAEQRRQLSFVVIGGGPSGVEMAGDLKMPDQKSNLAADARRAG